jgi:hypothetical protein
MLAMPIPPDVLRDTLVIWMYVTLTKLEDVAKGTTTADQIIQDLEQGKHIKAGDTTNQDSARQAFQAVSAFEGELRGARAALATVKVISAGWAGGGQHPKLNELDAVYIAPRS